ncbi:hypothetical protein UT300005_06410 [Clostridium sp. CTA-5]
MKKVLSLFLSIFILSTLYGCKKHNKEVQSSINTASEQSIDESKEANEETSDEDGKGTKVLSSETVEATNVSNVSNNSNENIKKESTLPRADFDKMREENFEQRYICFPEAEVTEIDNQGKLSSNGSLLILEKTEDSYGMYIVEVKGTIPINDKNGKQIKENDKIKIDNALVTNKLVEDIPAVSVSENDIEIIN